MIPKGYKKGRQLYEPDLKSLKDGDEIIVTWSGDNGPHLYHVRKVSGMVCAYSNPRYGGQAHLVGQFHLVGDYPQTQVWVAEKET